MHRILSHVSPDADGTCDITKMYDAYKFACTEETTVCTVLSRGLFVQYVQSVYPDARRIRRRINGIQQTLFNGIALCVDVCNTTQTLDFCEINRLMPKSMELKSSTNSFIEIKKDSGCSSNGNTVYKELKIYANGKFDINISGTSINLPQLNINPYFKMNKESVNTVFGIFDFIKLCNGLKYDKQSVRKSHTIETWKSSSESYRSLRPYSCLKVVQVHSRSLICRVCQQQYTPNNKENIPVEEKNTSEESTEDTIKRIFPGASKQMISLLMEQSKNVSRHPNGRRWSKDFIAICIQLYNRNPKCYELLKQSEILVLPSPSILILYKNSLKQEPGFDDNIFKWMHEEASRVGMTDDCMYGGIIFDEMSIQEDIQIEKKGSILELAGFTELGEEGDLCENLKKGSKNKIMGTHILQLLFLGLNGFRFPFAHFVTDTIQSSQLYGLFFRAVYELREVGFRVLYTSMDGAQCNRNFLHICLGQKPSKYMCRSPISKDPIIFIMDISHCLKKIRNNIIKSGIHTKCTRLLTLPNSHQIQWQMFVDFFEWDQQNALQLHRKLTREHIYPDNQQKMRNYLAFDMLDSTMLNSILQYKNSLGEKGEVLNGLIELLQETSLLVNIFQDRRPVCNPSDSRLQQLQHVDSWFRHWEENTAKKDKQTFLMSSQCHEDIHSSIQGFINLCETAHEIKSTTFVSPCLINSDIIENVFNQQRSTYNGANTNPNALQYKQTINSILIGQTTISKKANASQSAPAQPFQVAVKPPAKRKTPMAEVHVKSVIKVVNIN